jgi:hypothetical protein
MLSLCLSFLKVLSSHKSGGSRELPIDKPFLFTLFYSPCEDTRTAATEAVTIDGVAPGEYENKKKICKLLAILHLSLELQWQYRHMGCSAMSQSASEFLYQSLHCKIHSYICSQV